MEEVKPFPGLVIAMPFEGRALLGRAGWKSEDGRMVRCFETPGGAGLLAVISGPGPGKALDAARWIVARGAKALAVIGVAGGLDPALNPGDLVVAETVLESGGTDPSERWTPDNGAARSLYDALAAEGFSVRRGAVITVVFPLLTTEDKCLLHRQSGALAVDMESAAIARVAAESGIPLLVLRAVSDASDEPLAPDFVGCWTEGGVLRPALLARAIARRPALALSVIRTEISLISALAALRRAWRMRIVPERIFRLASGGEPAGGTARY